MNHPAKNRRIRILSLIGIVIVAVAITSFSRPVDMLAAASESNRPAQWAKPIKLTGVNNLYKIDEELYRSAQPTKDGMTNLERMGIKTVINLRAFHSDSDEMKGTALLNDALSVKTWHIEDEDVIRVLRILRNKENGPFLIHCQHGADRTGVMSAMYRIVVQGWSKDEAIKEMVDGGYGFHSIWSNIIQYVKKVDVDKIKGEVMK
jgi:protein tyrosine/serine phosphatase